MRFRLAALEMEDSSSVLAAHLRRTPNLAPTSEFGSRPATCTRYLSTIALVTEVVEILRLHSAQPSEAVRSFVGLRPQCYLREIDTLADTRMTPPKENGSRTLIGLAVLNYCTPFT